MHASRLAGILVLLGSIPVGAYGAEPAAHSFQVQGTKIHYVVEGQGEPVVLIHGLNSSAQMNWRLPGVFSELAKDHQVIALDLPGHGQSDKPDREEAYGLQLVEDVVLLLDHLKIKKAHIVGYSLGGMVTAKLAAKHPDRVLSVTLGGMGWLREGSALQKFWERLPEREGARTPSAFVQSIGKLALSKDELTKINVPVQVIVGDRDPVKRLYVEPLREARTDWPVSEIADAGHLNCIVKPEFCEKIQSWLKKNAQPPAPGTKP